MKLFPLAFFRSSIRKRIYAGFLIICGLLVLLSLVSLWGIWRINTATASFYHLNEQADLLIGIDKSTTEIQREAVRFMNEGRVSVGLSAVAKMHDLGNRLEKARSLEGIGEDLRSTLQRARGHLEVYEENFENAMQEKLLNDSLILVELPRLSGVLEEHLTVIHEAFPEENYLVALFRARTHLSSYFAELDSTLARKAFEDLDSLDLALALLVGDDAGRPEMIPFIAETRKLLAEYRERTARSVQATRAYLYLINVVMSGEVSEIIFKANQLRASGEVRKEELKARMSALIDRIALSIILISAFAVGGGLLYAVVIARQITLPLTRITSTLLDLSRGRSVGTIPGSSNADEIGDLAKSATVFHEKNVQTRQLLEQTDRLARALQEKSDALEASNSEMEQFVYTVSHDLKSPIITSMGFITMIRDLAREGKTEEAFSKLDRLERANHRMGELINDLLELSRVGRTEIETERLQSGSILAHLKDLMRPSLEAKGFSLYLVGDFPEVEANESRFMEIFENLISNALKYGASPEGHENRIEIDCHAPAGSAFHEFRVRDFGKGIPEAFHEKVFALFARLDKAGEGTGIGLTITRKLARLYGGDIRIERPDGPGACFVVALPGPESPAD